MLLIPTSPGMKTGDEAAQCACEFGPLATRRKRVAFACRCAAWALGPWTDWRVRELFEAGRAHASRLAPIEAVRTALTAVETLATEPERARIDVFTIFEGLRAGGNRDTSRGARLASGALRWAMGTDSAQPDVPQNWGWARAALAASAAAPECAKEWRTPDVEALARVVQAGDVAVLPILADALQDAGCDNELILGHCREPEGAHSSGCWVPDLLLGDG